MGDQTEWTKLDEHLHGAKREASTVRGHITRTEDGVVISVNGQAYQKLVFGTVKLNDTLLYDTRTWKTGDVITMTGEEV